MKSRSRREFLKVSGLSVPVLAGLPALGRNWPVRPPAGEEPVVNFFSDGEFFDGPAYWEELRKANEKRPVKSDRYGQGGVVEELEKKFAEITGKEAAIYMPSGTLANQLALAVLSGEKAKVFVQDTSHVYRDEADAAQSVFGKRLVPLAKDLTYFTAEELRTAIESLPGQEVFNSGIGCVSVENPVRRTQGRMVPLDEIKKISAYCRENRIGIHLDGARLYMASAWSGIPVREYSAYFDTVYISLYKYLGASGGAILCGEREVIEKLPHLIKVHGANMFGNWLQAAMALHRLDDFEERLQAAISRGDAIFRALGKETGISVRSLEGGTNIYEAHFPQGMKGDIFSRDLFEKHHIRMMRPGPEGIGYLTVNETLLYRDPDYIVSAITRSIKAAS